MILIVGRAAPEYVGDVCVGGGRRPVPVSEVAERVRDRFVELLPRPEPSFQPRTGGLTNLPVVFDSGQPGGLTSEDLELFGMPVHVEASPSWNWRFGDGTALRTTRPGSRYPDTTVAHAYGTPGTRTVTVDASWSGTFTIDGLGPFDVAGGPVTQDAQLEVVVRDAGAVLTAD